jgi:hypothetical protein
VYVLINVTWHYLIFAQGNREVVTIVLCSLGARPEGSILKNEVMSESATDIIQSFLQLFLILRLHKPVITQRVFSLCLIHTVINLKMRIQVVGML